MSREPIATRCIGRLNRSTSGVHRCLDHRSPNSGALGSAKHCGASEDGFPITNSELAPTGTSPLFDGGGKRPTARNDGSGSCPVAMARCLAASCINLGTLVSARAYDTAARPHSRRDGCRIQAGPPATTRTPRAVARGHMIKPSPWGRSLGRTRFGSWTDVDGHFFVEVREGSGALERAFSSLAS